MTRVPMPLAEGTYPVRFLCVRHHPISSTDLRMPPFDLPIIEELPRSPLEDVVHAKLPEPAMAMDECKDRAAGGRFKAKASAKSPRSPSPAVSPASKPVAAVAVVAALAPAKDETAAVDSD